MDILFQPNDSTVQSDITSSSDFTSHTEMTVKLISLIPDTGIAYNRVSDGTDAQFYILNNNNEGTLTYSIDATTDHTEVGYDSAIIKIDESTLLRAKLFDKNNRYKDLSSIDSKTYLIKYLYDISLIGYDSSVVEITQDTTIIVEPNSDYTIYQPYAPDCTIVDYYNFYGAMPTFSKDWITDKNLNTNNILTLYADAVNLTYVFKNKINISGKNAEGKRATNIYKFNYNLTPPPCFTYDPLLDTNDTYREYLTYGDFGYLTNYKRQSPHTCLIDSYLYYRLWNTTTWRNNNPYPPIEIDRQEHLMKYSESITTDDYFFLSASGNFYMDTTTCTSDVEVTNLGSEQDTISLDCDRFAKIPKISQDSTVIKFTFNDDCSEILWRNVGDTDWTTAEGTKNYIDTKEIVIPDNCSVNEGQLNQKYKINVDTNCLSVNRSTPTRYIKFYFNQPTKLFIYNDTYGESDLLYVYASSGEEKSTNNDLLDGLYIQDNQMRYVEVPSAGWYTFDFATANNETNTHYLALGIIDPYEYENYIDKSLLTYSDNTATIELFARSYKKHFGLSRSFEWINILNDSNIIEYTIVDTTTMVNPPNIYYDKWAVDLEIGVNGIEDNTSSPVDLHYRIYLADSTTLPDFTTATDMTGALHFWDILTDNEIYIAEAYTDSTESGTVKSDTILFKFETAVCTFNKPTISFDNTFKVVTVECDGGHPAAFFGYHNNFSYYYYPSNDKNQSYYATVNTETYNQTPNLAINGVVLENDTTARFAHSSLLYLNTWAYFPMQWEFKCIDMTSSCTSPGEKYNLEYPKNTMAPPYQSTSYKWTSSTWRIYHSFCSQCTLSSSGRLKYRINGGSQITGTSTSYTNVAMNIGDVIEMYTIDYNGNNADSWMVIAKRIV